MKSIEELLGRLFRPVRVLLIQGNGTSPLEEAVKDVCACEIDKRPKRANYDVVMVDTSHPSAEMVKVLKKTGPVVLVNPDPSSAIEVTNIAGPVTLLAESTEPAIEDLFRVLNIKTRTPELQAELTNLRRASGKSFAESPCAIQAV